MLPLSVVLVVVVFAAWHFGWDAKAVTAGILLFGVVSNVFVWLLGVIGLVLLMLTTVVGVRLLIRRR